MNQENTLSNSNPKSAGFNVLALVTLSIAAFLPAFMSNSLNVALPNIGKEFGTTAIILNWIVLAFVLANAALSLPIGRISDLAGIRKMFIFGLVFYALSSLAAVFAVSPTMLIVCRAAQGISGAMVMVNDIALLTAIFPAKYRGLALGINAATVYFGSSTGPFLGGLLTQSFTWRSIFVFNVVVCLVLLAMTFWKIKVARTEPRKEKLDYFGSIVYALSLVVLVYGFSLLPGITGGILIPVAIVGLLLFLWWENRTSSPVFDIKVFRHNRLFLFSNFAAFANYSAVFAVAFLLSLYLQYVKGLTPMMAGFVLLVNPAMQFLNSPLAGRISDKMEPRIISSIGMSLTACSLIILAFVSSTTPLAVIIVALAILGLGFSLFLTPNTNALMSSVDRQYYGVASATMSTMISSGMTISMGITMVVMSVVVGKVAITPEYYPAFLNSARITFGIFALLCLAGISLSISRGKMRK
jgi:EmrB/QacA subfamily drug resistance transporter